MGIFLLSQGPVAVKMVLELSVYWKCSIIHQGQHNDLKLSCGVKSLAIFLISFMIIGCVNQCSPEKENQLDRREGGRVQPLKKWHSHGAYDINWSEPTGFKMVKNSTSNGSWASLHARNTVVSLYMTPTGAVTAPRLTIKNHEVGGGPVLGNPLCFPKIIGISLPFSSLRNYPAHYN